jgi:cyclase
MSSGPGDHSDPPPGRVVEVAPGVYGYVQPDGRWYVNNTGFVAGSGAVLSIDTCATERRTRAYLDAVVATVGRRPSLLLTTHHHGDHSNGNCLLPDATILGHVRCREEIEKAGILDPDGLFEPVEWGELTPAPPFVTFEQRLTVHVDHLVVELIHLTSAAHTTNDVVAWLPESRVLFSGDLIFHGGTPFVVMGSVAGSLEALDRIAELDPALIVPGHGEPCGMETVAVCGEYLRSVQRHAEVTFAAGLTPLEAARTFDAAPFSDLSDPERTVGNLHRAHAECAGARPGADLDYLAVFADMVTMNGGKPLRCRA